jgi:phosphate uptake regulator
VKVAAATERIVVQVTTGQKRAITQTAKRLGLNVSELMRQAVQGFTPSDDEQEILALVDRVNVSTKEANSALDDALSFVAESNKRIASLVGGKS